MRGTTGKRFFTFVIKFSLTGDTVYFETQVKKEVIIECHRLNTILLKKHGRKHPDYYYLVKKDT